MVVEYRVFPGCEFLEIMEKKAKIKLKQRVIGQSTTIYIFLITKLSDKSWSKGWGFINDLLMAQELKGKVIPKPLLAVQGRLSNQMKKNYG